MHPAEFVSFAQNGEDVVLHRVLKQVPVGRYVEVGANDPTVDSISRSFYDRGWRGVTVEPMPEFAERHRAQRPEDTLLEAAVSSTADEIVLHAYASTGLSTTVDDVHQAHEQDGRTSTDIVVRTVRLDDVLAGLGWQSEPIHFMVVDTEGAEADVLSTIDLRRWRPWVLVVESTRPNSTVPSHQDWEPGVLAAGYRFRLFDGLSRFYVAEEHDDALGAALAYPACVHDNWVHHREVVLRQQVAELTQRDAVLAERVAVLSERLAAVEPVADEAAALRDDLVERETELELIRTSLTWRATTPVRRAAAILRGRSHAAVE